MFKVLMILAVATALFGNSAAQENKSSKPVEQNSQEQSTISESGLRKQPQMPPDQQVANTQSSHWYTSPEWWLCILGVPTLIVIIWQTNVGAVAAQAALVNAQAVINAERALLLFSYTKETVNGKPGEARFHIFVTNYGKAPARRIVVYPPIYALMSLEDLTSLSPPDYGEQSLIEEYLVPAGKYEVSVFEPASRWRQGIVQAAANYGTTKRIENMIYGQVTYFDGISADLRHSRYCFAHDRLPFSNIGGSLITVGTDEYLECT
jgi:hypothetical protein